MRKHIRAKTRKKIVEWIKRYGPVELFSLCISLAMSTLIVALQGSAEFAAAAGAASGALLYYGYSTVREFVFHYRRRPSKGSIGTNLCVVLARTGRDVAIEFGVGGALDMLVVRPMVMIATAHITPWLPVNVLIGKLIADIVYYTFAIIGYELKNRSRRKRAIVPGVASAHAE